MRSFMIEIVKYSTLAILFFLLVDCDVAIHEPVDESKVIYPVIRLIVDRNAQNGDVSYLTKVYIKNEKDESIKIAGGKVLMNNVEMSPPYTEFLSYRSYYKSSQSIDANTQYTFTVITSDSNAYSAWIVTPDIDLTRLDVPQKVYRSKNLTIAWKNTDFRYPQYLKIKYYDEEEEEYVEDIFLNIDYPYLGEYTINKKYVKYTNNSDEIDAEMRIKLIAETTGSIDKFFSVEGSIQADFMIFRDVKVYK